MIEIGLLGGRLNFKIINPNCLKQYPSVIRPFQDLRGHVVCGRPVATPVRASGAAGSNEEDGVIATQVLFFEFAPSHWLIHRDHLSLKF